MGKPYWLVHRGRLLRRQPGQRDLLLAIRPRAISLAAERANPRSCDGRAALVCLVVDRRISRPKNTWDNFANRHRRHDAAEHPLRAASLWTAESGLTQRC